MHWKESSSSRAGAPYWELDLQRFRKNDGLPVISSPAQVVGAGNPSPYLQVAQSLVDLYGADDARRALIVTDTAGVRLSLKYPFAANAVRNAVVVRRADIVLLRAEANLELGRRAEALADLHVSQAAANATLSRADLSDEALRNAILLERRKELAFEGHYLFDLGRRGRSLSRGDCPAFVRICERPVPRPRLHPGDPPGCDRAQSRAHSRTPTISFAERRIRPRTMLARYSLLLVASGALLGLAACEQDAPDADLVPPLLGFGDQAGLVAVTDDTLSVAIYLTRAPRVDRQLSFELSGENGGTTDLEASTPSPLVIPAGASEVYIRVRVKDQLTPGGRDRKGLIVLEPGEGYRLSARDRYVVSYGLKNTVDLSIWAPSTAFPQLYGYTSFSDEPAPTTGRGPKAGEHFALAHANDTLVNVIGMFNETAGSSTNALNLARL